MLKLILFSLAFFYFLYNRSIISEEYYFRFIGVLLMLCLQAILLIIWIVSKIRRLFQEYNFKITLVPGEIMNDPAKLNWKVETKDELFMNRYTEEGKLALRTNQAKERVQFEKNFAQIIQQSQISPNPLSNHIQNTQTFLQTLDKCRNIMNCFNIYPNEFGHTLSSICSNMSLSFIKVQQYHPCTIDTSQITDNQQQLLKNNKVNGGAFFKLPGWDKLVNFFAQMGITLKDYLKEMVDSNVKFITMSYNNIQSQDQIVCSQITSLQKQIEDTKKILLQLTEQERKTTKAQQFQQLQPDTAEAHQKWLYWLKKRYIQFVNLEQSIKLNQNKLKVMRQKVKYYRQNLSLLLKKHRNTYNAVLKTSLRGFLDSVYNSLQRSVELFNSTLQLQHKYKKRQKTRVQHLKIYANVQDMIMAEKKYQSQFMQRVDIHISQAQLIEKGLLDLDYFIQALIQAYQQFDLHIKRLAQQYNKQQFAKFHIRIYEAMSQTNNKFIGELQTLSKVNKKFIDINLHQLRVLISKIIRYKQTTQYQLLDLQKQSQRQNVIYKYKTVQERLLTYYKCLDQHIDMVMDFRKLYLKHTNRIKKSMLLFVYQKLMNQKRVVQNIIMSVDSKAFHRQISHIDIDLSHDVKALELQQQGEKQQEQQQGEMSQQQHISPEFKSCLNKLLFACYTEWSVSHFFKTNIHDSLYGALNDQPSEDFTQILINSIDFSGPAPRLNSLKQLKSQQYQCLFELNLSFYGSINLEITTSYKIFQSVIPLSVRAHITQMNMTVRICFVIGSKGCGWFSFIGEPAARIDVVPVVGSFTIDYAAVRKLIQSFIMNLLRKNVYPMKSSLRVPLYGQVPKKQDKRK